MFGLTAGIATAEDKVADDRIQDSDIPTLNADEGRVGEVRRVADD